MLANLLRRFVPKSKRAAQWRENMLVEAVKLREAGDVTRSMEKLREVLEREPGELRALNDLGACLAYVGRSKDAEHVFELAYSLDDTFLPTIINHARVLLDQKRGAEAMRFLRRAKVVDPEAIQAEAFYAAYCIGNGDAERAARFHLRAWLAEFDSLRHGNSFLWNLAYADVTEERIASEHRFWADTAPPAAHGEKPLAPQPLEGRRIRIGYLSPDFRSHSVRYFFRPLHENHDRDRFELFLYHDSPVTDAQTKLIEAASEHFLDVHEMSDAALIDRVREDRIDILVELAGHTSFNRLHLFQRRLAPVQMTALGDPSTTGLRGLDAKLVDVHAAGPDPQRYYTEAPVALPGTFWCFDPMEDAPEPAPPPVLAKGYVTFGCAGNVAKISARLLAAWKSILERVEDSRLLVRSISFEDEESRKANEKRFAAAGLPMDRVELLKPAHGHALYETYHELDIVLDTFPFNGGTTSCLAVYMGVPVVSFYGESLISRMGLSVMAAMGAADLAVPDLDAYADRAVALARDVDFLTRFRAGAREQYRACTLGNGKLFARDFERAVEDLLARRNAGEFHYETKVPVLPARELVRRAYAVARYGRVEAARRIVAHCLEHHPETGTAHLLRAQLMTVDGKGDEAIAYLIEQGSRLNPAEHASMLILAIRFQLLAGRRDAAGELLQRALALDVTDAFDREQLALYRCALAAADAPARAAAAGPARRIVFVVPCDEPERFDAIRRQVKATCTCPDGWEMDFERCRERDRIEAYVEALAGAGTDIVVLMQKNVEIHGPGFALEVAEALEGADVVGFAGARRWTRMDWRAEEYALKSACFLSRSREAEGFTDVNIVGAGTARRADGMAVLDGALLAARAGVPALFDEELLGSHALLEEFWSNRLAAEGRRLVVSRDLGVFVDAAIPLDTSNHAEARVRCADLLALEPFPMTDEDTLALSVPVRSPAEAAQVASAFFAERQPA
ncbi:hypothetical protein [Ramlibacter albus]|uniref:O-GlcNAc transferase C-terminal domain-containing protein n=1 Tax=Ramlibacter albus TaxID=2079448 RepID=A0A923S412_9BURK|nr:hypothetical protein [Ramlibacter albus]MBC5763642.1 hypothetical protein [Ramlibacter albus]